MSTLWGVLDAGFAIALLVSLAKAAAVFLVAELAARRLAGSSAASRHLIWASAIGGVLLLPLLTSLVPALAVPILTDNVTTVGATSMSPSAALPAVGVSTIQPGTRAGMQREGASPRRPIQGSRWLGAAWLLGVVLLMARLALGVFSARRMVRQGRPVNSLIQRESDEVAALLDMARIPVCVHEAADVPMTWGILRPGVILPPQAERWSPQRRRLVLVHEMAHIKRGDCLSQLAAHATCAVHWVNPLAWRAAMRLRTERELACDEVVVRTGARGSEYAKHLLDIAQQAGGGSPAHVVSLPMARPSQLEGRLLALLSPGRRHRDLNRSWHVAIALSTFVLILPLAAFQPWAPPTAGPRVAASQADREAVPNAAANTTPEAAVDVLSQAQAEVEAEAAPQARSEATRTRMGAAMVVALSDDDAEIRAAAAHALGAMGDAVHVDALVAVLTDADSDVRSEAAWALGMIESPAAIRGLISAAGAEPAAGVRSQIVWALGMIESVDAVDVLASLLGDTGIEVREHAAWALGMIESPEAVPALVGALADENVGVRRQAVWALGMIESDAALDALLDAMKDADRGVQREAMEAIARIAG